MSLDCPKEYKAVQNEQEQRAAGDRASEVIRTLDGVTLWGLDDITRTLAFPE